MLKVLAVVAGMLPVMLYGQRTLTGTVTDASNGEPLIGANILAVGTSTGTITDIDGSFTLEVPEGVTTLQVSYTGYRTLEVPIGASNTIDIQLEPGSILNEIVVIGYGTVKREDATGSLQSVSEEDFNKGAITGAQELLSGKVAVQHYR
jgi:iron complex outermembrane receptor protein